MIRPGFILFTFSLSTLHLSANDALDEIVEAIKDREGIGLSSEALVAEKEALPNWLVPDLSAQAGAGFAVNQSGSQVGPLAILKASWTLYDGGLTSSTEKRLAAEIILEQNLNKSRLISRSSELLLLALDYQLINLKRQAIEKTVDDIKQLNQSSAKLFKLGRAPQSMKAAMNSALLKKGLELNQLEIEQADIEMVLINELGFIPEVGKTHSQEKVSLSDINMTSLLDDWKVAIDEEIAASVYGWQLFSEVRGGYGPRLDALDPSKPEVAISMGIQFPLISRENREAKSHSLELRARQKYKHIQRKIRALQLAVSRLETLYAKLVSQLEMQQKLIEDLDVLQRKTMADVKLGRALPGSMVQLISMREKEQVEMWNIRKKLQYMNAQIYWINKFFKG